MGYTITVDGKAQAKQRPRYSRRTHSMYTPTKTASFEKRVANAWIDAYGYTKLSGAVTIGINFYYEVPKTDSKKLRQAKIDKKINPTKKPDIDNLIKSVLDGLNGVAYLDDCQVVAIIAYKFYGETAHTEITVNTED